MEIEAIAHFRSPFSSKFGIPKQSGLVESLKGEIVFVPKYRNRDSLRGLDEFDYIWLIWGFSANPHKATAPVVRPPVLGGNEKVGVLRLARRSDQMLWGCRRCGWSQSIWRRRTARW